MILLALVLGPLRGAPHAQEQGPRSPQTDEAILSAFREHADPRDLRRRLVPLGAEALPLLFRIAMAGRLPAQDDQIPPPLSAEERRVVREVLAILPRDVLTAFLDDLAAMELTPPTRLEAQRLLSAMGTADQVRLLARLTAAPRERGLSPTLRSGFERALRALLTRDPRGYARLQVLVREGPATLSGSLVNAMTGDPSLEGTRALGDLLGSAPGLDPLILSRIAERARSGHAGDSDPCDQVRRYLTHVDPTLLCAAALAAGAWGDDDALPALVDLLEHSEARVRGAAGQALREISGLGFGPEAARWRSWYSSETDWWESVGDSVLSRAERATGPDFVRAVGELLGQRLYRERSARSLLPALQRHDLDEVRLACTALGLLGSRVAVPDLQECLLRPEPAIRMEAARSLERITGPRWAEQ